LTFCYSPKGKLNQFEGAAWIFRHTLFSVKYQNGLKNGTPDKIKARKNG